MHNTAPVRSSATRRGVRPTIQAMYTPPNPNHKPSTPLRIQPPYGPGYTPSPSNGPPPQPRHAPITPPYQPEQTNYPPPAWTQQQPNYPTRQKSPQPPQQGGPAFPDLSNWQEWTQTTVMEEMKKLPGMQEVNKMFRVRGQVDPAPRNDGAFRSSGKTVVITGASQGVGRATARLFAKRGYNVVVTARDLARLNSVAAECDDVAGRQGAGLAIPCDVTREERVREMANLVVARYGGVDVVVNCAGVSAMGLFTETPVQEARRLMEVNYLGSYTVAQAFLPVMLSSAPRRSFLERPSLIFVNSFNSKVPMKYLSAFSASKHAVNGMAEAIRAEVEHEGVHIGQVHPGMVKSSFMERAEFYGRHGEEDRRAWSQMLRQAPMVAQSPQEVAEAIVQVTMSKSKEMVVGAAFAATANAYHMTGINPTTVVPMSMGGR